MNAEQQVIAAAEDRASALAAGDAERLAGLLHEGFSWTSHTGETYSRSEYVRRNTKGHTVWRSQRLSVVEVAPARRAQARPAPRRWREVIPVATGPALVVLSRAGRAWCSATDK